LGRWCAGSPGAKGKKERGATIYIRFGPDFASVFSNDSLDGGQADARALEIFLAMKALEDSKKFIGILGIEAHAIVANKNRGGSGGIAGADFDYGGLAAAGKFERIAKQVIENQFEKAGVAVNFGQRLDAPLHASVLGSRQIREGLANKQVEFGSLPGQIPSADLGKIQEVIHQVAHVIRAVENAV
jgi:hypothetical protein